MDYYADVVTTITGVDWYQGSDGSNVPADNPIETEYTSPNTGATISLQQNKQLDFESTGFRNINGNFAYLYRSYFETETVASEGLYTTAPQDTTQEISVPPYTVTSGGGSYPVQTSQTDSGHSITFAQDHWIDLGSAPANTQPSDPSTTLPDGSPATPVTASDSDGPINNVRDGGNGGLLVTLNYGLGSFAVGSNGHTFINVPSSGSINLPSASAVITNDIDGLATGASVSVAYPVGLVGGVPVQGVVTATPDGSAVGIGVGIGVGFPISPYLPQAPSVDISIGHHLESESASNGNRSFIFTDDPGHTFINDFITGGPNHDTLNLPSSIFSSLNDVLHHTSMSNGSATIHFDADNSITLEGVAKSSLFHQNQDFHFRP